MRGAALLITAALAAEPASACRQALAIGLDVSGSVDTQEFLLQVQGLAGALQADSIRELLLAAPQDPVALAVFDWSGAEDQRLILPWTAITDADVLDRATATIAATNRIERSPATGVGAALLFGDALLQARPECWRAVLDLTGDGINNSGIAPRDVTLPARGRPVTVNALVIGVKRDQGWEGNDPGVAQLTAWFRADVIRGPDAFVETALGFQEFAAAMERKLQRELTGVRIGEADLPKGGDGR